MCSLFIMRVYSFLLGSRCILCGYLTRTHLNICRPCYEELPIIPQSCGICAQFLPVSQHVDVICSACQVSTPPFNKIYAAHPYEFPIIQLVIKLKFQHQLSIARAFADDLIQLIQQRWYPHRQRPDCIIPIPLHKSRLKERGFNQSEEMARRISRQLKIPLDAHSVKRIKQTAPQSQLNAKERRSNIKGAFITDQRFDGKYIAVLDDVVTTGETIRECCQLLKTRGAARIDVWCVARR